ncbi:hypothetical protein DPEC_G00114270 [Dallia pectoralis]|uniref:Uncharacterized protein n=1 Tax=Dallia pectoralis TaxID=75939 RepID=A0ACC2GTZ4_DALPE|nr:hypothetical protein DPEC_G00114270 [Dallia pectoralis]
MMEPGQGTEPQSPSIEQARSRFIHVRIEVCDIISESARGEAIQFGFCISADKGRRHADMPPVYLVMP